mmetsp:Transcript_6734/g.19364  ORF Transcript_6734/g.19364 Transcript_6734/m.19364 type:complete len:134 (+) Transcript_6734:365-766(+)
MLRIKVLFLNIYGFATNRAQNERIRSGRNFMERLGGDHSMRCAASGCQRFGHWKWRIGHAGCEQAPTRGSQVRGDASVPANYQLLGEPKGHTGHDVAGGNQQHRLLEAYSLAQISHPKRPAATEEVADAEMDG